MTREEFERIANDERDGVATDGEREALRAYLDANPQACERYRELGETFDALLRVKLVEEPPELMAGVLQAIQSQARALRVGDGGFWAALREGLARRPSLRYAVPFAAGAGAGVLAMALVTGSFVGGSRVDRTGLSGAMAPLSAPGQSQHVDGRLLALDGARVAVETLRAGESVQVRLDARAAAEIEIEVRFDGRSIRPVAFRMTPPSVGRAEVRPNGFWIGHQGEGEYILFLEGVDARTTPLEVVLRSGAQSTRTVVSTARLEPGQ